MFQSIAKILIVADDLTGAADTGVQFSRQGWQTVLALEPGAGEGAEVLVLCSDTRGLESDPAAAEGVRALLSQLAIQTPLAGFDLIYKKIDSTLRGHPAAELAALVRVLNAERAEGEEGAVLIAPAFPAQGRTTLNGIVHVHNTPLERTSFAISGDLRRVFGEAIPILTLETIRAGEETLLGVLRGQRGPILADAESDADLEMVAGAALQAEVRIFCGSAGLAAAILRGRKSFNPHVQPGNDPKSRCGQRAVTSGVLVVAGSSHPVTAAQVEFARRRGAEVVYPTPAFYKPGSAGIAATARRLDRALVKGGMAILATRRIPPCPPLPKGVRIDDADPLLPPLVRGGRGGFCASGTQPQILELSAAEMARKLAQAAARTLTHVPSAGDWPVRGLILTGGDTARAVCRELGCTRLRLGGEVEPGIPLADMEDGRYPGLGVVTKAGGFGTEASLWHVYEAFKK